MIDVLAVKKDLPHIAFKCSDEYLLEALHQAAATPIGLEVLLRQFDWLNKPTFFGKKCETIMFPDSWAGSPARNFYWEIRPTGDLATPSGFYMNGGLVHHGDGDWSIHT